jgi:hypothetical protein
LRSLVFMVPTNSRKAARLMVKTITELDRSEESTQGTDHVIRSSEMALMLACAAFAADCGGKARS